ncbi:hypothetical protein ACFWY6_33270 [Streptomyces sp. NPDC059037]|uniref:hypothetical protein n=1 Tax=Streptomyces sp. NPDC059037 TaxID=3346710 RepID=UPI0036B1E2EA
MTKFAHRVVVLLSVNGLRTDCETFEAVCADHGWAILEQPEHPTGRQLRVVRYTVEMRMPGAYRGAVHGALLQAERVGREHRLDLRVDAADRLEPDSRDVPRWRPYEDLPAAPPRSMPRWTWSLIRRVSISQGFRDTGRDVRAATEEEALRLARHRLPGAAPVAPGIRVRSTVTNLDNPRGLKRATRINWDRVAYCLVAMFLSAALLPNAMRDGSTFAAVVVALVLVASCSGLFMARRNLRGQSTRVRSGTDGAVVPVMGAVTLLLGFRFGTDWAGFLTGLACVGVALVARGLYLFIHQRTWRSWVPWVLPALLPFIFGAFPGVGSFVHLAYLDVFEVGLEDVGVPAYYQLAAASRWAAVVLVLLLGPAIYGYARHTYWNGADRWLAVFLAVAFLAVGSVWVAVSVVLIPAMEAGEAARDTAARGDTPPSYYGIEPQWVCAKPLKGTDPAEIPSQGGEFNPSRRYLMLGSSGGTVVLWDRGDTSNPSRTADEQTLKLPLDKLRIVPAGKRCL